MEVGKLSAEEKASLATLFAAEEKETIKKIEKEKEDKEKEGKTQMKEMKSEMRI